MAMVTPIRGVPVAWPEQAAAGSRAGPGFGEMLDGMLGKVEQRQGEAARAVEQFLSGEGAELHSTLLAVQKAELTLELFLEARNKVLQAYQEIMRMQI